MLGFLAFILVLGWLSEERQKIEQENLDARTDKALDFYQKVNRSRSDEDIDRLAEEFLQRR